MHAHPGADERLEADGQLRSALIAIASASPWLSRVCVTDPAALDVLAELDEPVDLRATAGPSGDDLARAKRLETLRIAARDLLSIDALEQTARLISDVASGVLQLSWEVALGAPSAVAVIGMGKLGGAELNYSSDVDVLLVGETDRGGAPDVLPLLELARTAWRVDLDLRPEGRSGPAIRSLASYMAYWDRWAQTWEFQALIKGRPVAGDKALGARFAAEATERLWGRRYGADELAEVRRLKARAEEEVSRRGLAQRELKRGRGGIRDIEFAVQLLQLVHGPSDPELRAPSTLGALRALAAGGYVGASDAATFEEAYRFLRTVEHRLQLYEDQQVHTVPTGKEARTRLARVLGYRDGASETAVAQLDRELSRHQAAVRAIHERLFFRPLLEVFGQAPAAGALSPDAVAERLSAFGFADTARTSQAVLELTRGFSRTSQLMQRSLPLLLDWLSVSPNPDLGLLGLRTLTTEHHSRDRLTALCRESPEAARQLCQLLGTGPRFGRDLHRHPDLLNEMAAGDFLTHRDRAELEQRAARFLAWRGKGAGESGLRLFGRAESLRVAGRDVLGLAGVDETGAALSELAEAIVATALDLVGAPLPFAVIGMGRLGGRELAYSSDLDLMFVYDNPDLLPEAEAATLAEGCAAALMRMVGGTTPAGGLYRVDTNLRPEGRQGPIARSLDAYRTYYRRWAQLWERQALLRGRFIAGDADLGRRFAAAAGEFVWDGPFGADEVREIRRTKARVERERVPPSEDPNFHLKLGPGALTDVEWTAQLLQLERGVRTTGTVAALEQLRAIGVIEDSDAKVLIDSYRFCERTRNRLGLVRELPGDSLPSTGPVLTTLARSLGTSPSQLRDEYRRRTRRARRVVERLFYGGPARAT